jgi:hypothetical protein
VLQPFPPVGLLALLKMASMIKTPIWQALAALSWLKVKQEPGFGRGRLRLIHFSFKDIITSELLLVGSKVCDLNIKGGQVWAVWLNALRYIHGV